jgi:hypothetical protein
LERAGPVKGALLGASLFFFGNLMTALGVYVKQISVIYIGYGLFAGAGLVGRSNTDVAMLKLLDANLFNFGFHCNSRVFPTSPPSPPYKNGFLRFVVSPPVLRSVVSVEARS